MSGDSRNGFNHNPKPSVKMNSLLRASAENSGSKHNEVPSSFRSGRMSDI